MIFLEEQLSRNMSQADLVNNIQGIKYYGEVSHAKEDLPDEKFLKYHFVRFFNTEIIFKHQITDR